MIFFRLGWCPTTSPPNDNTVYNLKHNMLLPSCSFSPIHRLLLHVTRIKYLNGRIVLPALSPQPLSVYSLTYSSPV